MYIPMELDDGSTLLVEVEQSGEVQVSVSNFRLDDILDPVQSLSRKMAALAKSISPDEFTAEFGLSFALEAGRLSALLVKGSGEASIKVSLKWIRKEI